MAEQTLWVDGFIAVTEEWTEVGSTPWLHDTDDDYIHTDVGGALHREFTFGDSGVRGEKINSARLMVEAKAEDLGKFGVYLWDGSSWYPIPGFIDPGLDWGWFDVNPDWVKARLNTWDKINGAKIFLECEVGGWEVYVRRAKLVIDFSTLEDPKQTVMNLIKENIILTKDTGSDLASDAAAGQKDVVVADVSIFSVEMAVKIEDDNAWERNEIAAIDDITKTLTMVNNLANTYTVAANAKVTEAATVRVSYEWFNSKLFEHFDAQVTVGLAASRMETLNLLASHVRYLDAYSIIGWAIDKPGITGKKMRWKIRKEIERIIQENSKSPGGALSFIGVSGPISESEDVNASPPFWQVLVTVVTYRYQVSG